MIVISVFGFSGSFLAVTSVILEVIRKKEMTMIMRKMMITI